MGGSPTNLSYWYPRIKDLQGISTPTTEIVTGINERELYRAFDGEDTEEWPRLTEKLREAASRIGYPVFLRTDQSSAKHYWERTCFVQTPEDMGRHAFEVAEFVLCAMFMTDATIDTWVVREFLRTEPAFFAFYGNMPVTREFRLRVVDGAVTHIQPYWPPGAIKKPSVEGWVDLLRALNEIDDDTRHDLTVLAERVGRELGGDWSVDFLYASGKWWLIDMAIGPDSYWWDGDFDKSLAEHDT